MPDLLYEIGVEEIPAGYLRPAVRQLQDSFKKELADAEIGVASVFGTATPRRIVLAATGLADGQPDADEELMGPPVRVAFDSEGRPTKAAEGFARNAGKTVADIERRETPRGEYCVIQVRREGRSTADLLAEILPRITTQLSFPKSMVWPNGERPFARPVRSITALLGKDVIDFALFGLKTGRTVESHPILAPGRFDLESADFEAYKLALREHLVIVDMAERQKDIESRITEALKGFGGALSEEALVAEVTNLVQYPSVTVGGFDPAFLEIPAAVIEAAMMEHQRYFPVRNEAGALQPNFVVVSDRGPAPSDAIRIGNEEVLKARLADAQFFYQVDRKTPLADRVEGLKGVQFLRGLGSYYDKCRRTEQLAAKVAEALGLSETDAAHARRAAHLSKADLITEMVGEFPKLQGEVGGIYALIDGEPQPVSAAIVEHYMPKSAEGALPATPVGRAVSLAEKIDNMVSCFALGLIPTGSADPYALRRQTQAVLRIVTESGRHVDLERLLREALSLLPEPHCEAGDAIAKLTEFIKDRLFQMSLDAGAPHDLIHAAMAAGFADVVDFRLRLDALRKLAQESAWPSLVAAVERTYNISKNAPVDLAPDAAVYTESLEKRLGALYEQHRDEITRMQDERKYQEAGRRFADVFGEPLHQFFDEVFVNVDDATVRNNRLALLREINRLYSARIADLSNIVTGVQK